MSCGPVSLSLLKSSSVTLFLHVCVCIKTCEKYVFSSILVVVQGFAPHNEGCIGSIRLWKWLVCGTLSATLQNFSFTQLSLNVGILIVVIMGNRSAPGFMQRPHSLPD